jgi:hypothetical protein
LRVFPFRASHQRLPALSIHPYNTALASLDRAKMLKLATTLDNANNLGCPLS